MLARNKRALPPNVHMVRSRGREYFYFQLGRSTERPGPRVRLNDPWSREELDNALIQSRDKIWDKTIAHAVAAAKQRAGNRSVPFGIDAEFISGLATGQKYKCAVSGIEFEHEGYDDCHVRPFGISIDRVDPRHGYTKDNVRLVCSIANAAMGQWGIAALEKLADAIVRNKQ